MGLEDLIINENAEKKLMSLYQSQYADKVSFDDFKFSMFALYQYQDDGQSKFSDFSDWVISLDFNVPLDLNLFSFSAFAKKEVDIIDALNEKAHRQVVSTFVENRTLNIDITMGIDNIIKSIGDNDCDIDQVVVYADNADYDGLMRLKELGKKIKIAYIHNEWTFREPISLDDFIEMRKYINSVVSLIREQHFTPVEEILALYEIIKWYRYNFDENNPDNSRYIHSFVKTGEIVCAGYSKLFAQIAKELGYNAFVCLVNSIDTKTNIGHERNAIYIDDEHYGIHGLYYLDVTFDSTQLDSIGEKYGDIVQKSNLFYQCFLFNFEQYKSLFPDEYNPVRIDDLDKILPFVQSDFLGVKKDNLLSDSIGISLQVIKLIYRNVMLKQRVNRNQIDEMLSVFDEINGIQQQILEYNGANPKGFRR